MSILTQLPEPLYLGRQPSAQTAVAGFDMVTARAMAWAAQLAYETDEPAKIGRILQDWGWTLRGIHLGRIPSILPLTSAKGFIASHDDVSILTFAGTEPTHIADWIIDFSIDQNDNGVHEGFEAGVAAVWDTISGTLGAGGSAVNDNVLIAGHSLGGALAAQAAHRLVQEKIVALDRILGVYTFGMPRTGNEAFAQDYRTTGGGGLADRTYRLIDGADIVPQVPPRANPFTFRHVGAALACAHGALFEPANLTADAAEVVPAEEVAPLALLRGLLAKFPSHDLPDWPGDAAARFFIDSLPPSIRDHLMDRYLRGLGGL
jgi:triacylglycerol lipase